MVAAILSMVVGLGMLFLPGIYDFDEAAANNNFIVGPLVITFAFVALWELNRSVRYLNTLGGLWMIISPFLLSLQQTMVIGLNILCGSILIILSIIPRKVKGNYGGGWISLMEKNPRHMPQKE